MKMSEVLIKSQKTRKQVKTSLVGQRDSDGNPLSYCALGALACEKGFLKKNEDIFMSDIIRQYGVDPYILVKIPRRIILLRAGEEIELFHAIYRLNDTYEWSFKKIGLWLKKLEDEGVIKYDINTN